MASSRKPRAANPKPRASNPKGPAAKPKERAADSRSGAAAGRRRPGPAGKRPATEEQAPPGASLLAHGQLAEIQRGRILTAAVQAVEEVGYARITVAEIIGRAKVSRKTFYDSFLDREDCFLAAFEQTVARARALMTAAYASESGWRDGVRAALARLLAAMDEEPGLARLCIVDALAAGPRVLQSRAAVLDELARVIDRGRTTSGTAREPPKVTSEGIVGAIFAVLHARMLEERAEPLSRLLGPLMSMIVLPYLGSRAAAKELARPTPRRRRKSRPQRQPGDADPLEGLDMRLTYRTVRVLVAIAENPGASNREVGQGADVADQGQISKLLTRLQRLELVENRGPGHEHGAANRWFLTERGAEVERVARPY